MKTDDENLIVVRDHAWHAPRPDDPQPHEREEATSSPVVPIRGTGSLEDDSTPTPTPPTSDASSSSYVFGDGTPLQQVLSAFRVIPLRAITSDQIEYLATGWPEMRPGLDAWKHRDKHPIEENPNDPKDDPPDPEQLASIVIHAQVGDVPHWLCMVPGYRWLLLNGRDCDLIGPLHASRHTSDCECHLWEPNLGRWSKIWVDGLPAVLIDGTFCRGTLRGPGPADDPQTWIIDFGLGKDPPPPECKGPVRAPLRIRADLRLSRKLSEIRHGTSIVIHTRWDPPRLGKQVLRHDVQILPSPLSEEMQIDEALAHAQPPTQEK